MGKLLFLPLGFFYEMYKREQAAAAAAVARLRGRERNAAAAETAEAAIFTEKTEAQQKQGAPGAKLSIDNATEHRSHGLAAAAAAAAAGGAACCWRHTPLRSNLLEGSLRILTGAKGRK